MKNTICFSALLEQRLLHDRASQPVLRFLANGEEDPHNTVWSGAMLDQAARRVAHALRLSCQPGDRALLLYPQGVEFVAAFIGCLYAGVIAVPVAPPLLSDPLETNRRIARIAQNCTPSAVLTTQSFASELTSLATHAVPESTPWLYTDVLEEASFEIAAVAAGHIAFLQYTSGSTGDPKGVMVSHDNLLANLALIEKCAGGEHGPNAVSWLPQFHDMGLIGALLYPLGCAGQVTFFSPQSFIRQPLRWLQAISDQRANISVAPNFALDLVVRFANEERCKGLDLSSLEALFVGAEPVRARSLDAFERAFGPWGFRRSTFIPTYGMAEATLMASASEKRTPPVLLGVDADALAQGELIQQNQNRTTIVGCGCAQTTLAIVDPQTQIALPEGQIGEIWLQGRSIAQGYWNNQEQTEESFGARLAGHDGTFLRTGDMGACLDGQVFITGRCKDLIIVRGRNLFPQDIENTVENLSSKIRSGRSVAVSIERDMHEHLAIVFEVAPRLASEDIAHLLQEVQAGVTQMHGVEPYLIAAVPSRSVPMTSSGKVRRQETRQRLLAGELNVLAASRPVRKRRTRKMAFVLSSERAGSTLLRIMLSAHPQLFAPPELNLLPYTTLSERSRLLPPGQQDGLLQAVCELYRCSLEEAIRKVEEWEEHAVDPTSVLEKLQQQAGERMLIDKSPINSKTPQGLRRAAQAFGDNARYVHLVRHPYAMIDSYARLGLQRLLRDALPGNLTAHQAGEISWLESNRNIQLFLGELDASHHHVVRYEDLVESPEPSLRRLCEFLDVPFDRAMLQPYRHGQMTQPLREGSLEGDPNFFTHQEVDAKLSRVWQHIHLPSLLGPESCRIARSLAYMLPAEDDAVQRQETVDVTLAARMQDTIREAIAEAMEQPIEQILHDTPFFAMGLDSLGLIQLTHRLEKSLQQTIPAQVLFNHPTITQLAQYLAGQAGASGPAGPVGIAACDQARSPYQALPESLVNNDLPKHYQFDLDADIAWDRMHQAGVHIPRGLMEQVGIDTDALLAVPEAYALFQWAGALGVSQILEITEWGIIDFCTRERKVLQDTPRIHALVAEEEKHIQMFRRYAHHLRGQHPQLLAAFDRCIEQSFAVIRRMFNSEVAMHHHYQTWLNTLFGETFTLHLQRMLNGSTEPIQPTWADMHRLHAREEAHHIVTGHRYASSLAISERQKAELSRTFCALIDDDVLHIIGLNPAVELVRHVFNLDCLVKRPLSLREMSMFDVLQESGSFKQIRQHAPAMQAWLERGKTDESSHAAASGPEADAQLDEDIVRREGMLPGDDNEILLTGATGFLGAYLLHALLQRTEAHITCLVRCDDAAQGLQRLAENLAYYHLPTTLPSRVTVLPGDLSAPRLGLTEAQLAQLAFQIGVIYHNGATVDFLKPYALLREANVIATRDLLRLSVTGTLKTMHYVSSVASTPVASAVFSEQNTVGPLHTVCGGYGQTKWVGERLMQAAASRGIPVAIYRPGRIMGDSVHGTWNKHALLAMMMTICVQMEMAPDIATLTDLSPVDFVSQAIVRLARSQTVYGLTYNVVNSSLLPMTAIWRHLQQAGYRVDIVPYAEWRSKLAQSHDHTAQLLHVMLGEVAPETADGLTLSLRRLDGTWTAQRLAALQVEAPPDNDVLLQKYLRAMQLQGLIASPDTADLAGAR